MKGTAAPSKAFDEIIAEADEFVISPYCKTEVRGYMSIGRVDRAIVPEGWYAYDVREGDSGYPCTVEEKVVVNHYGTFLCQKPVKIGAKGYRSLSGRGGYTYGYDDGEEA